MSYDHAQEGTGRPLSTSHHTSRATSPLPRTGRRSPSPLGQPSIRVPERGNMVNGVQYDSLPSGDSNGNGSLSSFSLAQVEAGRTHPMLPPDEARLAAMGPRPGGGDAALGKNDLTNLKLASNQQVSTLMPMRGAVADMVP